MRVDPNNPYQPKAHRAELAEPSVEGQKMRDGTVRDPERDAFEGAGGVARAAYGNGGMRSNYPRGLAELAHLRTSAEFDAVQVQQVRRELVAAHLTRSEPLTAYEVNELAAARRRRRQNQAEERRLFCAK